MCESNDTEQDENADVNWRKVDLYLALAAHDSRRKILS